MLTEGRAKRVRTPGPTGLLPVVLPEIAAMHGVDQTPDHHRGDVWAHTLLLDQVPAGAARRRSPSAVCCDVAKPVTIERREAASFYGHTDRGADMAVEIVQQLKRSRETWERHCLVKNHLRLVSAPEMRLSTLKRMLAEDGFDELLHLARVDALASSEDLQFVLYCERRRASWRRGEAGRLLSGRDLIAMGFGPDPGSVKPASARDGPARGQVTTRDEAVAWVPPLTTGAPSFSHRADARARRLAWRPAIGLALRPAPGAARAEPGGPARRRAPAAACRGRRR
jgi:poly(A) polymerase